MIKRQCDTCFSWIDFCQFYDDPEEPRDHGFCQNRKVETEITHGDESCEFWMYYKEDQ